MTVTKTYQFDGSAIQYIGLSTDTKDANGPIGALFYETNTRREYIFSSTNDWVLKQMFSTTNSGI